MREWRIFKWKWIFNANIAFINNTQRYFFSKRKIQNSLGSFFHNQCTYSLNYSLLLFLNGQTRFGGTPTLDPHHGNRGKGVNEFQVYFKDVPTRNEITDQIKDYDKKYSGDWSCPVRQYCHSLQEKMLKDLNLEICN